MARGIIREYSFAKVVSAYRSQWKRFWMRLFTFGLYGSRGMGWWNNPKRAWYNFRYRRTSVSVYRLFGGKASRGACFFAMMCASVISVIATPVDATRAGVKAHKIKKERQKRTESTATRGSTSSRTGNSSSSAYSTTKTAKTSATPSGTVKKSYSDSSGSATFIAKSSAPERTVPPKNMEKKTVVTTPQIAKLAEESGGNNAAAAQTPISVYKPIEPMPIIAEETKEFNENTPKSNPKNEGDQYIRKRMIIAGSYYCDSSVLSSLSVSTYFDLQSEQNNPYDKNAVVLLYHGQKIGYVAKADVFPFVTCLKLNRRIYGVITDIRVTDGKTEFEYETWFDSVKQ